MRWGGGCLLGTELQFRKVKNSGDGSWSELHNDVNVLNITEQIVCFILCDFCHN